MVVFPRSEPIPTANLQKMLYDKQLISIMAKQIVAGQVEAHIEMACDYGNEYKTFKEVENCIQGAKETVGDYLDDILSEFRDALYAAAREAEITVKNVTFEGEGLKDAEVEVK